MRAERSVHPGAFLLAVAALTAVTSGPLFRVRTWWDYDDPLGRDGWIVALHAAFGALAVAWLATRARWRQLDRMALALTLGLIAWIALSALWSLDRPETARQAAQLLSATAVGAATVVALGAVAWRWALWTALHVGLGWSFVAIYLDQPGTIDDDGEWAGIFFNRNSLALYAALALLVTGFLVAERKRSVGRVPRWLVVGILVASAVAHVVLIAGADGLTPLIALTASVVTVGLAILARRAVARGASAGRVVTWAGAGAVAVALLGWATRGAWLEPLGRDSDLTGRADVWSIAFDWAWRRPLVGFGYLGPWGDAEFLADIAETRYEPLTSAHNSFIEVFLGAGVIGVGLLVALFVALYRRTATDALVAASPAALFPLAIFVFVLVENLAETLFVGNQLMVALLGALLVTNLGAPSLENRD